MGNVIRKLMLPLALGAMLLAAGASAQQKDKDKDKAKDAGAVFEVYKDKGDEFRFRLNDGDGTLLANSGKGYKTKAECLKVVETIKKEAAKAKVEEVKPEK
jgi:uncharacterized protein YegP (UPF0339 family)